MNKGRKRVLKAIKDMMIREIAGEVILVPVGQASMSIHGMISLSESGVLLWKQLQNECSQEDLVNTILEEYDVDEETAKEDVKVFVNKMKTLGIIE